MFWLNYVVFLISFMGNIKDYVDILNLYINWLEEVFV